ncbi:hypothetical protein [Actinokineospora diospyrosa]|uniref:Uncharacterized protein n=1 Tax=Actinokineospora diospyrosa TaxID=103728 RepID=A0ABT1I756_9PSEU|nr:hypothetical protein [Actinokineospora diospyrosa]MCP2268414.1 hypothetical protein [Actinokineospora diospyrosa]
MPEPTTLSIVLAAAAGLLSIGRRLWRADWTGLPPWLDLAAAVVLGIFADALADTLDEAGWWVVAAALVLGFCGFGFLAGAAALTVLRLPDPGFLSWVVVPLLIGFAFGYFLRTTRGSDLPVAAAAKDGRRPDKRWGLAAVVLPYLPMVCVLAVPLPGGDYGDTAVRIMGAAMVTTYLVDAERTRYALLRPRRWTTRAAEISMVLAYTAFAASPAGERAALWWAETPGLAGWGYYRVVLGAAVVFVALAWLIANQVVRGPLMALAVIGAFATRLVMLAALLLTACVSLFHPHHDLLVMAAVGGLPAALVATRSTRLGLINRQFGDVGMLVALDDATRNRLIDDWVTDTATASPPDLSLSDVAGALAYQTLHKEQPAPPWRPNTAGALGVAEVLLDAVDRRVVAAAVTDERLDRARRAARGDLALWQAKISGERDDPAAALAAAKDALAAFESLGAPFATALAWSAIVDHAGADPDLDPVAEIDGWIAAHELPTAAHRHVLGSAARAALDRADPASARDHLQRAVALAGGVAAVTSAMRADRVHFGATPRELCGMMIMVERRVALALPPG